MNWDTMIPVVDTTIDDKLGNDVEYAFDGQTFEVIKAYVDHVTPSENFSFGEVDPLSARPKLKVGKYIVETPSKRHRIKHRLYGDATYRPENWTQSENGRYWLIDLQKV